MRKVRVKEFVNSFKASFDQNPDQYTKGQPIDIPVEQSQCDMAKFVQKYMDSVNSKQYQQLFCNYNETMFAQLMLFSKIIEIKKDEFLHQAGDSGGSFWFVMEGKLEILVKSN